MALPVDYIIALSMFCSFLIAVKATDVSNFSVAVKTL